MSRTKRKVPHWVSKSEQYDKERESRGEPIYFGRRGHHDKAREERLPLRKQVETGNFDMSDHEAREDKAWRRKMAEDAYKKSLEE